LNVVEAARRLSVLGLNPGKAGNVSERTPHGFLITPSGKSYESLEMDDLVEIAADGTPRGRHEPSSEWRLHHDIYARHADAQAVAHTHSPFATTLACLHRGIPPFHYEVALAGGVDIRCAGYATFGTQQLSDLALDALEGRRACLLANHGSVAFGDSVEAAVLLAEKVEALARVYWQAIQVGEPPRLDDGQMAEVLEKYRHYGRS
jgi:L-fuculose-phosphate aldolase